MQGEETGVSVRRDGRSALAVPTIYKMRTGALLHCRISCRLREPASEVEAGSPGGPNKRVTGDLACLASWGFDGASPPDSSS